MKLQRKKCDSHLNEDEKNLEKNYDQKEYSKEDDVNFETRIERNSENKNYDEERQECNEDYNRSCDIIDYCEERSNNGSVDYNKRRYVATNYGEKRRETNKDYERNYERDYCYYERKPEQNKDNKRRISNKMMISLRREQITVKKVITEI